MAEPDRTNADAERVSAIVAKLRAWEVGLGSPLHRTYAVQGICEAAADIIEAQSKALAEARVVKPLEWSDWRDSIQGLSSRADTPFGTYRVDQRDGHCRLYFGDAFVGTYDTADNAKVAAQADYAARILSALLTPTPENPNG